MSNLAGSYKVGVGEAQSVDLREQERRARLLLLDGIREPSPQPIFGEPVKVELEDETSRRIKNTLGDVTEVLMNDPKSLMCISRSASAPTYPPNGHQVLGHPSNNHPMSGLPSIGHSMSGAPPSNSHHLSGHPSSQLSGHSSSSLSMPGHAVNSQISGHSSYSHMVSSGHQYNSHLMSGAHQSSTHSMTGHQSSSHPMSHPQNNHQLPGHPSHCSTTHPISGHPSHTSNNHQLTGHSSGHPGHPSSSHSMHATGHPSSNYMAGNPMNVHSIPGHTSNGHPISGYSATGFSGAGHSAPSRPQAAKKVSLPASNANVSKPSNPNLPNMYQKTATDKRNSYNRQKPDSPVTSKFMYNTNYNAPTNQHSSIQQFTNQETRSWNTDQKKASNTSFNSYNSNTYNVTTPDLSTNVITSTGAPIYSCGPETPAIQLTPFHLPPCATPSPSKPVYNIPSQNAMAQNTQPILKYDAAPSLKRPAVRPSHLKIERKPTSPIGVETILKEMTKPVPALLTAIQTPRTEETGFAFPPEPKEELPFIKVEENANPSNLPQEQTPMDICQPSPMPYTSSLQDDLEMSESDDDEVVPEKKEDTSEFLKSPSNNPVIVNNIPTPTSAIISAPMETNSASSSSSESGDSDSDDDSSESNNSDSSSESSDEDTSSMKWGLSNFVDESRRNHSPAFRSLEMQKQLNISKSAGATCPPVQQPLSQFIVPDASVTAKSDLLSPIRSPAHPPIGPRTPPSPVCSSKDVCDEKLASANINEIQLENSVRKEQLSDNLSPVNESKVPLISDISNVCDERNDNAANTASDVPCSEVISSPVLPSLTDSINESCVQRVTSDKDTSNIVFKPSPLSSDIADASQENYPIKTRQKGTVSTKKKSSIKKSNDDENQKVDDANSPIAKFKHPRACRKSNEKPANPVTATKTEQTKDIKKRLKPTTKQKEIVNTEKGKSPQKSQTNIKKTSKAAIKLKNKINKSSKSFSIDNKKSDIKNKKKKFTVENFLQSPTHSSELPKLSSTSPEKMSLTDNKKNSDPAVKGPNSNSSVPKSTKSNSKNKTKNVEKLRRSVRCSERASSLSQSEDTPVISKNNVEETAKLSQTETSKSSIVKSKKPFKKSLKSKSHSENLPSLKEPPIKILSPIPHNSATATTITTSTVSTLTASKSPSTAPASTSTAPLSSALSSDPSSSNKIMVCIPLSKLLRIPNFIHHLQESETGNTVKSSPENLKQKIEVIVEKASKNTINKSSQSKDFKNKPRSNLMQKSKKKSVPSEKKESSSKPLAEISKSSIVNKNNGKSIDKQVCDVENKLSKKRKLEGDSKSNSKKKPKSSARNADERKSKEQIVIKTEPPSQNDSVNKPKPLERCDSASSLNSLCSQRSSKSLKDKKDASLIHESKRLKTSMPTSILTKEIKQEKEDRPKVHIKKEPLNTEKISKIREKSSDVESKEKGDSWIDSHNQSSQFHHWEDTCKDEPKLPLDSIIDNLNRYSNISWDHFSPEMHKELKEASALKMLTDQGPIMPMDYYWTEGRKMKKMAEMEKDPFQQAVKFYEAAVLYVLTSQQKEENCKNPDAVYQFYYETLSFTTMILSKIKKLPSCPGSTEFKLLILCLKCQSLLNVKLYSLKIKEIKEQLEGVTDFFRSHCSVPTESTSPTLFSLHQSRISSLTAVSSPHSVIPPSPNSVSSQTSGYASSDISGTLMRNSVCVPQTILDTIYRQHTHLKNLHMGHDLWEQADMYLTRSNLKEFFKEVADESEPLTLHSTIKELVSYMQKGICLVKNYLR